MSQPRIITGMAKGTRLHVPEGARPITDRIKTTVFDLIREQIPDAEILDLHAGSGTMGLEALSRGAESAIFVDKSEASKEALTQNIESCNFEQQTQIINSPLSKAITGLASQTKKFDLIFADPPFPKADKFNPDSVITVLKDSGIFVLRRPTEHNYKTKLQLLHSQQFGSSVVDFYGI